jgi:cobalt-zinc-cadmium efflux system outer membrane protein
MSRKNQRIWLRSTVLVFAINCAWAQQIPSTQRVSPSGSTVQATQGPSLGSTLTLKQAFDAAWQRQPEAKSQLIRQSAAIARSQAANNWLPEPVVFEVSGKTDRLNKSQGSREIVAGVSIPLWLSGERAGTAALADAEMRSAASRISAAQLRTAASVRDAYWLWHRTRIEHEVAIDRLRSAQQLAMDVTKRVKAGDLAKSDQYQADGAMAFAEVGLAEAWSGVLTASQQLRILVGEAGYSATVPASETVVKAESVPEFSENSSVLLDKHPALTELLDRSETAQRHAELVLSQSRANPELTLTMSRDKGQATDPYQQAITVGMRIPFGSDNRNRAKAATAQAEAIEARTTASIEKERLVAQLDAARQRLESVQVQETAAKKRAQLAKELLGFIQKSFRLGESDLPARLRIESETIEAERQAARFRVDLAAAVSALRQALGLLPT